MIKLEKSDIIKREVTISLTDDSNINSAILDAACENVSCEYWEEFSSFDNTFTITAETTDELYEKMLELYSEIASLCQTYSITPDGKEPINIEDMKKAYSNHRHITVDYGGESSYDSFSEYLLTRVPRLFVLDEIEDDHFSGEIVYFYNTKETLISEYPENEREEKFKWLTEGEHCDYPEQDLILSDGETITCYGDVVRMPKHIADEYLNLD